MNSKYYAFPKKQAIYFTRVVCVKHDKFEFENNRTILSTFSPRPKILLSSAVPMILRAWPIIHVIMINIILETSDSPPPKLDDADSFVGRAYNSVDPRQVNNGQEHQMTV